MLKSGPGRGILTSGSHESTTKRSEIENGIRKHLGNELRALSDITDDQEHDGDAGTSR